MIQLLKLEYALKSPIRKHTISCLYILWDPVNQLRSIESRSIGKVFQPNKLYPDKHYLKSKSSSYNITLCGEASDPTKESFMESCPEIFL